MNLFKKILSLFAGLIALSGCTKGDLLNVITPRDGYSVRRDIVYGDESRQKLDVYIPDTPDPSRSTIVFFYGGSWQMGDKALYRFVGQAFASKGYFVVVADYRLYPQVYFPAFVEDAAQSVAWTHKHIAEYGGNPSNIFLSGHSAGAYIALMLTLNDRYLKAAGVDDAWIKGAMGIAGPYDFLPFTDPAIIALFSKADNADTQPITFVRRGLPPILLLTGDEDTEVGAKNSRNLAAKLREFGDPVEEKIYPGIGHIGMVLSLASAFRGRAPVRDDMLGFIRATLDRQNP